MTLAYYATEVILLSITGKIDSNLFAFKIKPAA